MWVSKGRERASQTPAVSVVCVYGIIEKMQAPTVVYSLLPHENKMSVVHYVLRRTNHSSLPIKSKVC